MIGGNVATPRNFVTYTEAREQAIALGAKVEGIYSTREGKRIGVHWFNEEGLELCGWVYGQGLFYKYDEPIKVPPPFYEILEKEVLQ